MNRIVKYRFVQDDDCHWYLIMADDYELFCIWVKDSPYWDEYKGPCFDENRCDSPECYTFDNPVRNE